MSLDMKLTRTALSVYLQGANEDSICRKTIPISGYFVLGCSDLSMTGYIWTL